MHNYQVKVGSVYYQPTLVRINMELSPSPWTFEVEVPGYPTGLRSSDTIDIYRDGVDILTGKVLLPTQNFELKQGWKLVGVDYTNFLLKNGTYALRGEVSQEPRTTIQSATSYAGVSNGSQDAYGSSVPIRIDWNQCIDVISMMTGRIGWETLVHPVVNTLDFKSAVGSDKSSSVAFRTGENCLLANHQDRRDQVVNRIWAKGKGTSDTNEILLAAPYYVESGTSQGTYGIRSKVIVERDIYTQAGLLTRANTILAKLKDSWPVYSIKVKDQSKTDLSSRYWVGDTVAFKCGEMGISGNYRINSMGITWDENDEFINLELNKLGLAFQNLAEQERSYLLGLYGPQIFSTVATDQTQTANNQDQTASNQNTGFNTGGGSADEVNVDHVHVSAPAIAGGSWTNWWYEVYDIPAADEEFWIKIVHSAPLTIMQKHAILPGSSALRSIIGSASQLWYIASGTYTLSVLDSTESAMTMDRLKFYVYVWGEHTHVQNTHDHTQDAHNHTQDTHIH